MNFLKKCCLIFLIPFFSVPVSAQNVWFRKIKVNDELSESFVYTITQGNYGYLWIGTGDGLFRYDGKSALKFSIKDSLSENFITASAKGGNNRIWFGHFLGGISYYDGIKFHKITSGYPLSRINAIANDESSKSTWFVSQNRGLLNITDDLKSTNYTFPIPDALCYSIGIINSNTFLIGTDKGLFKVALKNDKLVLLEMVRSLPADHITGIVTEKEGSSYWILTQNSGLFNYKTDGTIKNYSTKDGLLSNNIQAVCQKNNSLFVATSNGASIINLFQSFSQVTNIGTFDNAENAYFSSVFKDREDNVWMGSFGKGVVQVLNQRFEIFTKSNRLLTNQTFGITKDSDQNYWLATDNGVTKLDNKFKVVKNFPVIKDNINTVCADVKGNIWVGTNSNSLFIIDKIHNTVRSLPAAKDISHISYIIKDKKDHIWVATISDGLLEFDESAHIIARYNTSSGMVYNDVLSLFEDSKDRIWFASNTNSFGYIENGKVNLLNVVNTKNRVEINYFAEDKNHIIWMGTDGYGLYKYDNKEVKPFEKNDLLLSQYCYSLSFFNNKDIWVAHKNGYSKYDINSKRVTTYTSEDGLESSKNNPNAVYNDNENYLWFGTQEGVVKYNPAEDKIKNTELQPVILGAYIDNEFKDVKTLTTLPAGIYNVKFNCIAVSLNAGSKILYQYKLEGYDNEWSEPTADPFVIYSHLSYGSYTLKVKACNSCGTWSAASSTDIVISTPFFQATWFYIAVILLLFTAVYLYIVIKTKYIQTQNRVLEAKIRERTAELEDKNEEILMKSEYFEKINIDLEYQKDEYTKLALRLHRTNKQLDNFAHTVAHDLKAPLRGIGNLLNWIIENDGDKVSDETREYLQLMYSRLDLMDKLIVGILDYSKITGVNTEDFINVNTLDVVNDVIALLPDNKNFKIEIGDFMPTVFTQKIKLQQVFKNLIGNAIKYHDKENGLISVKCLDMNNYYQFSVTDDGPGIEKKFHAKIFNIFQTVQVTPHADSTGIGLSIVKKIIEDFGGKTWVESVPGEGATFIFTLPKRATMYDEYNKPRF